MSNKLMEKRTLLIKVAALAVVAVLAATLFVGCSANGNSGQTPINQNNNNAQGVQTPVVDNSESEKLEEIVIEAKEYEDDRIVYTFTAPSGTSYNTKYILYTYLGIAGCYAGVLEDGVPDGSGVFWDSYQYIGDTLLADGEIVALGDFENGHLVEGSLYDYKGGTYVGHFSNDKPNGYGVLTINDVEYVGDFVDGELTIGAIVYDDEEDDYYGEISNLQPNGYGAKWTVESHLNGTDVTRESSFTDSGYYQNGSLVRAIAMPTGGTNGGNSNSNNSGSSGSIDFGSNNSLYDDPPCSGCNGSGMQDCMFCGGDGMTKEFIPGGGRDSSFSSYIDADCSYCTGGQMRCRVCGGSG